MYTVFISDLHLNVDQPAIVNLFVDFLRGTASNADALYILGDLVEVWVGDDDNTALAGIIKQGLRELTQSGVPVYLMPGNRDFLLGKQFMAESGCQLIPDPSVIDLYGVPTLFMHGDLLCTDDIPYLRFRSWVHRPLIQQLFLGLPLRLRQKLAERLREKSKRYVQEVSRNIMDATPSAIEDYLQRYQVNQLIHGHTHRPTIHLFKQANQWCQRIVLSDWDAQGHVLICHANAQKRLVTLSEIDKAI